MMFRNWQVRWKLALVIGIAVLTVSVTIAYCAYAISVRQMVRDLDGYMGRFVHQLAVQFDMYFQDIDKLAAAIWLNQEVLDFISDNNRNVRQDWQVRLNIANFMSRQMYYRDGISGIFLILTDGTVVSDSNQKEVYVKGDFPKISDDADRQPREIYPQRRGPYGNYVISYVRTLRDLSSGALLGHLVIDIRLTEMDGIIYKSSLENSSSGYIEIVNENHHIVYHPDRSFIDKTEEEIPGEGGGYPPKFHESEADLVSISAHSPFAKWYVLWRAPKKEMLEGINFIRNITFLIGLAATMVSVLMAVRLSFAITFPLEKLQGAMKKAEKGDLLAKAPVYNRDEIGQVALTFNKMLDRIEQLTEEIVKSEFIRNQAKLQEKQAMLNSLRAQINPHFLYNTLDTLMGMVLLDKKMQLHDGLHSLSHLFRYSLSSRKVVTMAEEISHVRNYFKIIELRFEGRYALQVEIPDELLEETISPLILQPLVENGVKHGLEPTGREGCIFIKIRKIGALLSLRIEDNGVGIRPGRLEEVKGWLTEPISYEHSNSIGLQNVFARIKLVYGDQAHFAIDSEEGKFCRIHLIIPSSEKTPPFH